MKNQSVTKIEHCAICQAPLPECIYQGAIYKFGEAFVNEKCCTRDCRTESHRRAAKKREEQAKLCHTKS